ncbi:Peroxidase 72 [Linum perenne]
MAPSPVSLFLVAVSLLALAPSCLCGKNIGGYLYPQFYDYSCPQAQQIVKSVVAKAVSKEPRMAASLLRLHFHDCFVKGCDASILLDGGSGIVTEKNSNLNRNSARGFEVIDEIKSALEKECPSKVSCADILTLAARDSTVLVSVLFSSVSGLIAGGPSWEVPLGRRDSKSASLSGSNNNIPAPNNTFRTILTKFKLQGLNTVDLVALSGSHTIGNSRCTSFRQRLYNQTGLDPSYASQLKNRCPPSGGDQNLFFFDFQTPFHFDNIYFKNILASKGLLNSDQVLLTKNEASMELVKQYAENNEMFFLQFAKSMVKMGNISPLTGSKGEIRKNCRKMN